MTGSLATVQLLEAVTSARSRSVSAARLDRLEVPDVLRPALPALKVTTSAGLVVGLQYPRVGAVASGTLVGFYAAAIGFHRLAGDRPVVALPAALFGALAAMSFFAS